MNLFYQPGLTKGASFLDEEESRHAIKVLRLRAGDSFVATDGQGSFYTCRLTKSDKSRCSFEVLDKKIQNRKGYSIHLGVAPTKNLDRMEWLVEKATELGVDQISFILCRHAERRKVNGDRIKKIVINAMKQSFQPWLPLLSPMKEYKEVLKQSAQQKFIAHVDKVNPHHLKKCAHSGQEYLVLIGPEGDFTAEEIGMALNNGFEKVSLGPNRLRTETAALAACHILNLINE